MPGFGETSAEWMKYGKGYKTRQRVVQADGLNVDPKLLTAITDRLIDAHALRHAIDAGGDDRALADCQQEAITLISMGLDTVEKIQSLIDTFKADRGYEIVMGHRVLIQYASQAKAAADQKGSNNGTGNKNTGSGKTKNGKSSLAERAKQYEEYNSIGSE
jgi:hypothetical protein